MTDTEKYWIEQSRYDYETSKAMLKSGRYLYVLFCCQQAVEKAIKSIICNKTKQFPPRIHQLVRLADVAELEINEEKRDFLRELSAYYIQSRYPEEVSGLGAGLTKSQAEDINRQTGEMLQWLSGLLK